MRMGGRVRRIGRILSHVREMARNKQSRTCPAYNATFGETFGL